MNPQPQLFPKNALGESFALEYGAPLPERERTGIGFPVFGSNGVVGRHSRFLIPGPGIVVGRKGSVGEVSWSAQSFWPIDTAYYVAPKDDTDLRWLYWLLSSTDLRRLDVVTGVPGLNRNDVYSLKAHKPPSPDQSRIAAVLDTVDEAISKTEAVIAKLRQVRAGMLHDLLTRGLDTHGQLRDPIAHPEQFQDSPLGHIPREWAVRQLEECYAIPSRNGLYKKVSCYGFGRRMIHMPQMFKGVFVDVEDALRVAVDPQELQRYALQEGDILFARRSLNLEGAGLCSMVGKLREPATFESSIVRVRVIRDIIVPRFAVEFLRSPAGYLLRRHFIRQVAVSGVSSGDIAQFLVPCPKPPEQECILSLLDAKDIAIRLVEEEAGKLVQLKSGLMTDLLTGRVRVPNIPNFAQTD